MMHRKKRLGLQLCTCDSINPMMYSREILLQNVFPLFYLLIHRFVKGKRSLETSLALISSVRRPWSVLSSCLALSSVTFLATAYLPIQLWVSEVAPALTWLELPQPRHGLNAGLQSTVCSPGAGLKLCRSAVPREAGYFPSIKRNNTSCLCFKFKHSFKLQILLHLTPCPASLKSSLIASVFSLHNGMYRVISSPPDPFFHSLNR